MAKKKAVVQWLCSYAPFYDGFEYIEAVVPLS